MTPDNERIAKEAAWLAFSASARCGSNTRSEIAVRADRDDIEKLTRFVSMSCGSKCVYTADTIFGRKLALFIYELEGKLTGGSIKKSHQDWLRKYPTYEALFEAARRTLREDEEEPFC